MIVVADTTPLNYLVLIEEVHLLQTLYRQIVIPPAVLAELTHPSAPATVLAWARALPPWVEVRAPGHSTQLTIEGLDLGETQAILLAEELPSDTLIIDEALGRAEAARRGLIIIGTLGILRDAANAGLLDLNSALARLKSTTFRADPSLFARVSNKL